MITYLVSSPGGDYIVNGKRFATNLNTDNGFVDSLRLHWKVRNYKANDYSTLPVFKK